MATVMVSVPDIIVESLNGFYDENYGYDLRMQVFNFLVDEYEKVKDAPSLMNSPRKYPYPSFQSSKDGPCLVIKYPDKSRSVTYSHDWNVLIDFCKEWAKYQFSKDMKTMVRNKVFPEG